MAIGGRLWHTAIDILLESKGFLILIEDPLHSGGEHLPKL